MNTQNKQRVKRGRARSMRPGGLQKKKKKSNDSHGLSSDDKTRGSRATLAKELSRLNNRFCPRSRGLDTRAFLKLGCERKATGCRGPSLCLSLYNARARAPACIYTDTRASLSLALPREGKYYAPHSRRRAPGNQHLSLRQINLLRGRRLYNNAD